MNFQHYRNFVAIVDAGTLSAASKALFIAQPALSNQLKAFENEYGAQLVVRGARQLTLTDAGQIFYDKAKTICYLEDAIKKEIQACTDGTRGTLWLGLTPAFPDPVMADMLLRFHEQYPEINFEIMETDSGRILELLHTGVVEVGVIRNQPFVPPTLQAALSVRERLMAVYAPKNPWLKAGAGELSLAELEGIPLSVSQGFKSKIEEACLNAGFRPRFLSVSTSRGTALTWARRGAAVAIIVNPDDASYRNKETEGFCCRPLKGRDMRTKRTFAVLQNKKLSAMARAFLEFCKENIVKT